MLAVLSGKSQSFQVSDTKYDYSEVAAGITAGCSTKYEQAKAIYRWLCRNISYDTSYSIYTADECWDRRKGVCQAYCELFYRLAEPLGIRTFIISGDTKESLRGEGPGHAWLFVVTEGEGTGILIDPTWGAGSVDGNVFVRSENDMSWFHVDPYWMIFTHYPDDKQFQLLDTYVSPQEFLALPDVRPVFGEYGFRARDVFRYCMANGNDMPQMNTQASGKVFLQEVPFTKTLRIGQEYTFSFRLYENCRIAVVNNGVHDDWAVDYASGTYSMSFVPSASGDLSLSIQKEDGMYWSFLQYEVAEPTGADLRRLEAAEPLSMPEITGLRNFNRDMMESLDIDGSRLLSEVRAGKVKALPVFYTAGVPYSVVDIPLNEVLYTGVEYTFTVLPKTKGLTWAVVNGDKWFNECVVAPDSGAVSITVTPESQGQLLLVVNTGDSTRYLYCIEYVVR